MRLSNRKTHSNKNSKGVFGWGENREDEKQGEENMVENVVFHCLVEERKQERQKIEEKVFPSEPTFFN